MGRRRPVFRLTSTPTPLHKTSQSPTSPRSPLSPPPIPALPRPSTPTSPSSTTNGPLTPPLRLHLRAIIPSPPLPAEYFKTAPPFPYPWIWRCHLCRSVYRLGVTRRCLEDGHFFCSLPSLPTPSPSPPSPDLPAAVATKPDDILSMPTLSGTPDPALELKAASRKSRAQRRKNRRRAASRGCHAEFDYGGWAGYNTWRGEVRLLKRERMRRAVTRSRTRVMRGMDGVDVRGKGSAWASGDWDLERGSGPGPEPGPGRSGFGSAWGRRGQGWSSGGGRDCWRDCNFPSECHHERREERLWEAKMREERRWEESEEDLSGSESESESESESPSLRERERRRSEDNSVPIDLLTESVASMEEDFEMGCTGDYDEDSNRDGDDARDAPSAEIRVRMELEREEGVDAAPELELDLEREPTREPEREPDIDFTCMREAEAEEDEGGRVAVVALGPLGTDCDGLGEAGIQECYTRSVRRKSLGGLGAEGSPSSSPLKEVAFGFEDVIWGGMGC
ncbi:uncharacterized protein L3040_009599 [Drepanopeziza brunnea f. sp. 'multigermtubi']|uniref:Uncharacterized protein n=1 Tax=Marssonina brunnea f. sp. multigermtubi (strain MB_m1) TaxID=1072389 RepID=K1WUT5_MARBU|nr:uncharacterized protein MBM_05461 [Drepanopeziza brunnea f. sp. 'multigermtubi' MB_m1]EKD16167.1 hypothetical protein MBM_05461 [Drepanopeziza brunnea f. sp. 'multigermtubi' MB_m1]KAJ5033014.1 hypothetical protein L3040_009599 [Drepanopeziza brunnea f. sp. 'multigermtubi']